MFILVSTGLVEPVVRCCCLCIVVFSNLVTFPMQENIEQRYAIKFWVKLNKSATETFASLTEAYGVATQSRTMVFKWHKAFKVGLKNGEVDPHSGRPISSQMIKMWKWCELWWRKTADWVSGWLQKKRAWIKISVHRILTEHAKNMCKIGSEKLVCGAKCEPIGNLSGFAGKTRNWAKFFA